jgi:beta-glucanase (GH16 family)
LKRLWASAAGLLLASCGGGGTSTPELAAPPAPVVSTATGDTGDCVTDSSRTCIAFSENSLSFVPYGGLQAQVVADPVNTNNRVAQLTRSSNGLAVAGVALATSIAGSVDAIYLSDNPVVTLRARSPKVGAVYTLRLESGPSENPVEARAVSTQANAWETLSFDFGNPSRGTYNPGLSYHRISLHPEHGQVLTAAASYWVDELKLNNAPGKIAGWTLVWSDEFDAPGLPNSARWDYDTERNRVGWFNNELQYYARARSQNARVEAGRLVIAARRERLSGEADYGGQAFSSARLVTRGKASWTYGFMDVRAKLPCSLGTWPAIWTLGTGGTWPDDGEIDLMEQRGTSAAAKKEVLGTVHTRAYNYFNGTLGVAPGSSTALPDACAAFHNYQLTWSADRITISVDGRSYFDYPRPQNADYARWPFDRPQYLLLNLAMGGDLGGAVPANFQSDQMEVEYVRVYQR